MKKDMRNEEGYEKWRTGKMIGEMKKDVRNEEGYEK